MFKFSTLDSDSYTFVAMTLLDNAGETLSAAMLLSMGLNVITIVNNSGSARVFRVCGGCPFPVAANGGQVTYDLRTNGVGVGKILVEVDTATHTSLIAFGA